MKTKLLITALLALVIGIFAGNWNSNRIHANEAAAAHELGLSESYGWTNTLALKDFDGPIPRWSKLAHTMDASGTVKSISFCEATMPWRARTGWEQRRPRAH